MHDGKYGRHLEQALDAQGAPTDLWLLVNYGDSNHATRPYNDLAMSRSAWLELGNQIDMMSLTEPVNPDAKEIWHRWQASKDS